MFQSLPGLFIQPGSEPGKRFQFLKLGVGKPEIARDFPVCGNLGPAPNP